MLSQVDNARLLESMGFSVLPVPVKTKKPLMKWKHLQEKALTWNELPEYFGDGRNHPGIITGKVSGVVVVDCDTQEDLEWALEHLPQTPLATNTSRGRHLFYRHPGQPVSNRAHIAGRKLDVRGDGGYVLAPGAIHPSGTVYEAVGEWTSDTVEALPIFDLAWLEPEAPALAAPPTAPRLSERGSAFERASKYAQKCSPAISGSGGDEHTFQTVSNIARGFALSENDAMEILLEHWNPRCSPPWTDAALRKKVRNALSRTNGQTMGGLLEVPLRIEQEGRVLKTAAPREKLALAHGATMTQGQALAAALRRVLDDEDPWEGTATELHELVQMGSSSRSLGKMIAKHAAELANTKIFFGKGIIVGSEHSRVRLVKFSSEGQLSLLDLPSANDQESADRLQDPKANDQESADRLQEPKANDQESADRLQELKANDQESADRLQEPKANDQDSADRLQELNANDQESADRLQELNANDQESADRLQELNANDQESADRLQELNAKKRNSTAKTPEDEIHDNLTVRLKAPESYPVLTEPLNFWVKPDGVWVLSKEGEWSRKLDAPCLITNRLRNIADGTEQLTIAHRDHHKWVKNTYSRKILSDGRTASQEMAEHGFPVVTAQGKDLSNYLHRFFLANQDELQTQLISNCFGWQGPRGENGFLMGKELIGGEGSQSIQFVAQEGLGSLADGIRAKGSFSKWCTAFHLMKPHPRVMICLYASFAAPLISILDANSFVIDLCGETSRGKTTALKACASVYGNTELDTPSSLIQSWNSTAVAMEMRASTLHHLPLLLDDTKQITSEKDKQKVGSVIYMIAGGQGRQRGSLKGMRVTGSWSTVAISTGEQRMRHMTTSSGSNARMLTLWGLPFSGPTNDPAADVKRIGNLCRENFGHAGTGWIKWIQSKRGQWAHWKQRVADEREKIAGAVAERPEADRITEYMAVIKVAGELVHECYPDLGAYCDVVAHMAPKMADELKDADTPISALQDVYDWACSNPTQFYGQEAVYNQPPTQGWAGKWSGQDTNPCFFRTKLQEILTKYNYNTEEILQRWQDRKYLVTDIDKKRMTRRHRINSQLVRLIEISQDCIFRLCKLGPSKEEIRADQLLEDAISDMF
jgi:hypothetical protein